MKNRFICMRNRFLLAALMFMAAGFAGLKAEKFVGGDVSLLPTIEKAGATYYDKDGKRISDLVTYSRDQGMNAMRVRLFVDPDTYLSNLNSPESWQTDACQSYEYILPICKRIKDAGMKLLLDFHYSDTWADPDNQWTPAAWTSLSDDALGENIYEYTKEILTKLKTAGYAPDFIQTGNEISYGMCWGGENDSSKKVYITRQDSKLTRFGNLLKKASQACREICPEAKIVIHTERVPNTSYTTTYYDWLKSISLDYDIIGLSYYSYYHGRVSQLNTTLTALENKKYGKDIWIVETGQYINWLMGDSDKQYYDTTDAGQNQFATDLLAVLDKHSSVNGLFWWEMEYNAKGTSLKGWYNASLFDNLTGKATSAFYTIAGWSGYESSGSTGGDEDITTPSDFYLLYNQGGDWSVPGTQFSSTGNGTFKLKNIEMYQDGNDYAWFAITSVSDTDWGNINANRYGPIENNTEPSLTDLNSVVQNENSWQIPKGTYDLTFNTTDMTLKVRVSGTEEEEDPSEGVVDPTDPTDPTDPSDPKDPNDPSDPSDKPNDGGGSSDTPSGDGNGGSSTDTPPSSGHGGSSTDTPPSSGDGGSSTDTPPSSGDGGSSTDTPPSTGDGGSSTDTPPSSGDGGSSTDTPPSTGDGGSSTDTPPSTGDGGSSTDTPKDDDDLGSDQPSLPDNPEAGINGITPEEETPVFYNLQGQRVNNPGHGIFIRVCGGKRTKIVL